MSKPFVIYGPPGSGKSRYARRLARHYGLAHYDDEWEPGSPLRPNTLHLTTQRVPGAIPIEDALRAAGVNPNLGSDV